MQFNSTVHRNESVHTRPRTSQFNDISAGRNTNTCPKLFDRWPHRRPSKLSLPVGDLDPMVPWLCFRSLPTRGSAVFAGLTLVPNTPTDTHPTLRATPAASYSNSLHLRNVLSSVNKTNRNWSSRQCPLRDRKTSFRLIINSHVSTNQSGQSESTHKVWAMRPKIWD